MIDLRPYVARIPQKTGIGTQNVYDASYPYLIQINYRAGFFTHYAGAGTIKSCKVAYHGQETDLCLLRTFAKYDKSDGGVRITTNPVTVTLDGKDIAIQSVFTFHEGSGKLTTERKLLTDMHGEEVTFTEYFTGGFGTTEYQADMTNITLGVDDQTMQFNYHGRKITGKGNVAFVTIPEVSTTVQMGGDNDALQVEEGIAFSPVYHMRLTKTITKGGLTTWLNLQKAN